MKTLRSYIAKQIYLVTALVFFALMLLFAFFDLIHELSDLGEGNYGLGLAALHVLLSLPGRAYEIIPVAGLIGSLFALTQMVTNSEYAVMRSSGLSIRRMAFSLAQIGLTLSLITFLVGELIAPVTEQAAQKLRLKATTSKLVVAQAFQSGLWVKDQKNYINVTRIMPETVIHDVDIYEFDSNHRLVAVSKARRGEYQEANIWKLRNVVRTNFRRDSTSVQKFPELSWESVLSPEILTILMVVPEQMSLWELYFYIQHLEESKQETIRYTIAFWQKIIYPFAVLVMVLMALPFANTRDRQSGIGKKVFFGIMLGLSFHLGNRLFGHIGLLNAWPPFLSAAIPTIGFLALTMWMMGKNESN